MVITIQSSEKRGNEKEKAKKTRLGGKDELGWELTTREGAKAKVWRDNVVECKEGRKQGDTVWVARGREGNERREREKERSGKQQAGLDSEKEREREGVWVKKAKANWRKEGLGSGEKAKQSKGEGSGEKRERERTRLVPFTRRLPPRPPQDRTIVQKQPKSTTKVSKDPIRRGRTRPLKRRSGFGRDVCG